ncbi:uncharacterized protein LOC100905738 [Galendromus occidentalis]|uniref:Uncharacterized protein LOC100905738 n=1 Tax=Galendromus occidentalis TaxID=34638 RepID=A0AAJ6QX52_9ACAR|nr:uncharacterized protein LOC100905738 [Galendromus occidentalis]
MIAVESLCPSETFAAGISQWTEARRRRLLSKAESCCQENETSATKTSSPRLVRLMFVPFCLAGIVESPEAVWTGKSGVLFKIYSGILCILTFAGCFRTLYFSYHYDVDPLLGILKPKLSFYSRLIYTIVAVNAFGCRLLCFRMFNFGYRDITDAYRRLSRDPVLSKSLQLRTGPFIWFHFGINFAVISFLALNFRICLALISEKLPDLDSIIILVTSVVSVFSTAYGHGFLSLIATMIVCDVLRRSRSFFIEAVRTRRVEVLREAIRLHCKGHDFVKAVNIVFRNLLGMSLTAAVPLFSTVCTFLTTSQSHAITEMMILMYIAVTSSIFAVIVSVSVAARVNNELEMHAEVLRNADVDDEAFERIANRFLRRFNKRPGFTFFKFGTVTRETLLTAFGLMTNYYIVGIQLDNLNK